MGMKPIKWLFPGACLLLALFLLLFMPAGRHHGPCRAPVVSVSRYHSMANQQLVKGAAAVNINFSGGTPSGTTAPPDLDFSLWQGNTQIVPNTPMTATSGGNYNGTSTDGSALTVQVNGSGQPAYTVAQVSVGSGSSLANAAGLDLIVKSPNNAVSYAVVDISGSSSGTSAPAVPRRRPPMFF